MRDLDPFDDLFDDEKIEFDAEKIDWETLALREEIDASDLGGEQDHDDIDPDVAYDMGYAADPYSHNPFEHGTEAADRWLEGRDAAELDAWQGGELPTQYREPD